MAINNKKKKKNKISLNFRGPKCGRCNISQQAPGMPGQSSCDGGKSRVARQPVATAAIYQLRHHDGRTSEAFHKVSRMKEKKKSPATHSNMNSSC